MILRIVLLFAAVLVANLSFTAQTIKNSSQDQISNGVRSSPAYSEILLRKTELEADLESLLIDYTEEYPKIKEIRFELSALEKNTGRVLAMKPADEGRLTLAVGRLIVRKAALETELWSLLNQYKDGHPDVKRARKKVDIFERAIREILG